jgi:hypothetical protein
VWLTLIRAMRRTGVQTYCRVEEWLCGRVRADQPAGRREKGGTHSVLWWPLPLPLCSPQCLTAHQSHRLTQQQVHNERVNFSNLWHACMTFTYTEFSYLYFSYSFHQVMFVYKENISIILLQFDKEMIEYHEHWIYCWRTF